MISKELLSEVLECITIDSKLNSNIIDYCTYSGEGMYHSWRSINIYELAHKCKEWVFSNKWLVNERQSITGKYEYQCMSFSGNMFTPSFDSIFDLCQWILENR